MFAGVPHQRLGRGSAVVVDHAAASKRLVELSVEVVAVGEHQEGEVATDLPVHLPSEHHHRVTLAGPLGVPEDPELSLERFSIPNSIDGLVHAQELVVLGHDLFRGTGGLIKEDEVLHQVDEVRLVADALEHRLHVDYSGVVFVESFPLVEVPPLAGDRPNLPRFAVGEHHDGVVVEEVRDGVPVVRVVLFERHLEIAVDVLALDEEQRQSIHKPDDVSSPAVEVSLNPEFADTQEVVVLGVVEIEHAKSAL